MHICGTRVDELTRLSWIALGKLLSGEYHRPPLISQHWFNIGAVRQQAIKWANVDPELCHHMDLLGHNVLPHLRPEKTAYNLAVDILNCYNFFTWKSRIPNCMVDMFLRVWGSCHTNFQGQSHHCTTNIQSWSQTQNLHLMQQVDRIMKLHPHEDEDWAQWHYISNKMSRAIQPPISMVRVSWSILGNGFIHIYIYIYDMSLILQYRGRMDFLIHCGLVMQYDGPNFV